MKYEMNETAFPELDRRLDEILNYCTENKIHFIAVAQKENLRDHDEYYERLNCNTYVSGTPEITRRLAVVLLDDLTRGPDHPDTTRLS
jgi:hypothetical protein